MTPGLSTSCGTQLLSLQTCPVGIELPPQESEAIHNPRYCCRCMQGDSYELRSAD